MKDDDADIWALYAKSVKPLGKPEPAKKKKPRALKPSVLSRQDEAVPPLETVSPPPVAVDLTSPAEAVLDRNVERNLREGDVIIEARLDLHGLTMQEAYEALGSFIAKQTRIGKRLALVITGKGRDDDVTLRNELPRWCAEPVFAQHILALRSAAPQHGGAGAWYVLLRKR